MKDNCHIYIQYGAGNDTPLQYSCLENPMDRGAWKAAVHGVTRSRKWLSNFTFTFHFHALEKEMATHSSVLAWRIPGMAEPGGLPSMGSHRVGHGWRDLAAADKYYMVSLAHRILGGKSWLPRAECWFPGAGGRGNGAREVKGHQLWAVRRV